MSPEEEVRAEADRIARLEALQAADKVMAEWWGNDSWAALDLSWTKLRDAIAAFGLAQRQRALEEAAKVARRFPEGEVIAASIRSLNQPQKDEEG